MTQRDLVGPEYVLGLVRTEPDRDDKSHIDNREECDPGGPDDRAR
jgi:hypothetical protein